MTLREIKTLFTNRLEPLYEPEEINSLFALLAEEFLGYQRYELSLHMDKKLNEDSLNQLLEALERLQQYEPVQYIVGYGYFDGLRLKVGPAVLIPRPETEELVAWIHAGHPHNSPLHLLDVCTGSGCIALALKNRWPDAHVEAFDHSGAAMAIALENSQTLDRELRLWQQDVFKPWELKGTFDIVVSNPPYVTPSEKEWMHANVLRHEPAQALFVPADDPLLFYREIGRKALGVLKPGGALYLEINERFGQELSQLLRGLGYTEVELKQDFLGKDRFIKAIF